MHASTLVRLYSRSEHVLGKYSSVAAILRGEQIREPTPPELPPQQGLTAAEKARTAAVYSAEYQAYVDQRVKIREDKYNLKDWLHNSKLERSFRTKFETTYPDHATMELEIYIQTPSWTAIAETTLEENGLKCNKANAKRSQSSSSG